MNSEKHQGKKDPCLRTQQFHFNPNPKVNTKLSSMIARHNGDPVTGFLFGFSSSFQLIRFRKVVPLVSQSRPNGILDTIGAQYEMIPSADLGLGKVCVP